jgi:hypothetical protein
VPAEAVVRPVRPEAPAREAKVDAA